MAKGQHRFPARTRRRVAAAQPERSKQHWRTLDGLRAVAVVAVMISHLNIYFMLPGGYGGVDVFFVLSGFLITTLLIEERDKRGGRNSFRNFYARRALRLFPALGGVIIVAVTLTGIIAELDGNTLNSTAAHATLHAVPWVVLYLGNFVPALNSVGNLGWLTMTWSLAVEEQFYIVWPAVFVLLVRHRFRRDRLAYWLTLIALADIVYSQVMAHLGYYSDARIYFGTDTHAEGLVIGCAVAFWLSSESSAKLRPWAGKLINSATCLAAIVLMGVLAVGAQSHPAYDLAVAALASGVIVLGLAAEEEPLVLRRFLSSRVAIWIGRRSYGLYLWHYVVFLATEAFYRLYINKYSALQQGDSRLVGLAVRDVFMIATSFMVAAASYRFIELPALRLKRRFDGEALADRGPGLADRLSAPPYAHELNPVELTIEA